MLPHQKTYLLIGALLGIIVLLLSMRMLFPQSAPAPIPTPTPAPQEAYSVSGITDDYNRITEKQPLSTSDANARQKLLNTTKNQSGIIKHTDKYTIEYVKTPDYFMIELDDNNAGAAMSESINWLKQQGLSDSGVCNLPVVYYLGSNTFNYYKSHNLQFDPMPAICKN